MKAPLSFALLAIAFALAVTPSSANGQEWKRDTQLMIEEEFSANDASSLVVETGDADVTLETSKKASSISVEIFLSAKDLAKGTTYFEAMNFQVERHGNTISITSESPKGNYWNWRRRGQSSVLVKVLLPVSFDVDIRTSDGDITADEIHGETSFRSSDGDLRLSAVSGTRISIGTSDGDIIANDLISDEIKVKTSDGDIRLADVNGSDVEISTSDGSIDIESLDGDASVRTSDGDISIDSSSGTTLLARTSDGDISIDRLLSRSSNLTTSDGEVSILYSESAIEASTGGGDIILNIAKGAPVSARSGDGDISIQFLSSMGADVSLRGESVHLASRLKFDGKLNKRSAQGSINGGGPEIRATANDGDVTISHK